MNIAEKGDMSPIPASKRERTLLKGKEQKPSPRPAAGNVENWGTNHLIVRRPRMRRKKKLKSRENQTLNSLLPVTISGLRSVGGAKTLKPENWPVLDVDVRELI